MNKLKLKLQNIAGAEILSREQLKKVMGGYWGSENISNATYCSSAPCYYYTSILNNNRVEGKCASLTGPMQVGCGCEGKYIDDNCYLKYTG